MDYQGDPVTYFSHPCLFFESTVILGLPWWSMVESLPCNAEDLGSITGLGAKILHALGQLSL